MQQIAFITNYETKTPASAQQFFAALQNFVGQANEANITAFSYSDLLTQATFEQVLGMDVLILSSAFFNLGDPLVQQRFAHEVELVRRFSGPILGMCFGHHIIGKAFGLEPSFFEADAQEELNPNLLDLSQYVTVFGPPSGDPEYVPGFAPSYLILIEGLDIKLQFMQHKSKPIYGFGFYPELNSPGQAQAAAFKLVTHFLDQVLR